MDNVDNLTIRSQFIVGAVLAKNLPNIYTLLFRSWMLKIVLFIKKTTREDGLDDRIVAPVDVQQFLVVFECQRRGRLLVQVVLVARDEDVRLFGAAVGRRLVDAVVLDGPLASRARLLHQEVVRHPKHENLSMETETKPTNMRKRASERKKDLR